jgi:signal transduction histidine kinase
MSLRSHLLLLTLVVLLPLAIFGAGATLWVADREWVAFEEGARQRTLALLTAVDAELNGHVETLRALASSYSLQTSNLPAFYRQAMLLLATQKDWRSIVLAVPSGQRVLDTSLPFGSSLSVMDRTGACVFRQGDRLGRPGLSSNRCTLREVRDVSRGLLASAHGFNEREEKLHAADQAKDEFLAMLGHELRNPLGAQSAATQVLNVSGPGDKAAKDATGILSRQVERMTRLVDDLLDVGGVISGKVRLQLAPLGRIAAGCGDHRYRTAALRWLRSGKTPEVEAGKGVGNVTDRPDRLWQSGSTAKGEGCRLRRVPGQARFTERPGRTHRAAA